VSQGRPPSGDHVPSRYDDAASTGDEPINRLAAAIRRINAVATGHPVPDENLARAAEQLARIAESLENSATTSRRVRELPNLAGHPQDFFPGSPIIGFANPIAPPAEVWLGEADDGQLEIRGRVTFGYHYEGPPGCVHGGVIAELFDELMGAANVIADKPGMTGTLTVRYRKPTPLLAPLDLVARCVRSEGRKVHTRAAIYHQGALTAEANGLFIQVRPEQMLDMDPQLAQETAENTAD
jgi:acyl-coenzyme A thioesterase PaaI-like protein